MKKDKPVGEFKNGSRMVCFRCARIFNTKGLADGTATCPHNHRCLVRAVGKQ